MKRHKGMVSIALGLSLSATAATANVEVGLTAGAHVFSKNNELGVSDATDATSLRNSALFGLRLGWMFTDMLGVELEGGIIPSEPRSMVFDVYTMTPRANIIAQFRASNPANRMVPFVLVGGGFLNSFKSDNENVIKKDWDEFAHIGVGFKYRVDNGWGLRADGRALIVPSSEGDKQAVDYEALLSVYKEWGRPEMAKEVEVKAADADGDGINDDMDKCPNEAEVKNNFQDDDGCPDTADTDGDGVDDANDKCTAEAEDMDGFEDTDGCPELDNDKDGINDDADACKADAEDMDGFEDTDGCPELDNDKDGVVDANDKCQDQMETINGFQDGDGCADELPKQLAKFTGVIKGITFKTGSAEIAKSSDKTLKNAAKVLAQYPELKVEVQGHTDDVGDRQANIDLSQARAESVRAFLIGQGVGEGQLSAKGFGPDSPAVPYEGVKGGKLKKARAANRRVEFKLLTDMVTVEAPAAPAAAPATP